MTRGFAVSAPLSIVLLLSGCIDQVPEPPIWVPHPSAPELSIPDRPGLGQLQCLSLALQPHLKTPALEISVGPLPNRAGPKIGELSLPADLQQNVITALSEIPFVDLRIMGDPGGDSALPAPQRPPPAPPLAVANLHIITGGITLAQETYLDQRELEIFGYGPDSKVKAIEVDGYLGLIYGGLDPKHYRTSESKPVPWRVKFATLERGLSLFVITHAGLVKGEKRDAATPSVFEGLQYAVDLSVATVIREAMVEEFGIPVSAPKTCGPQLPEGNHIVKLDEPKLNIQVQYNENSKLFCSKIEANPAVASNFDFIRLEWSQYAFGRDQQDKTTEQFNWRTLQPGWRCLPQRFYHPATTTMEVKAFDPDTDTEVGGSSATIKNGS